MDNNLLNAATSGNEVKASRPTILRYSFDHVIQGKKTGEPLDCIFYITTAGKRHYIKRLSKDMLLLDSSTEANMPTGLDNHKTLDQVVVELYLKLFNLTYKKSKKIACSLTDDELVSEITAHLTGVVANMTTDRTVPSLLLSNAINTADVSYITLTVSKERNTGN